MKVIIHLSLSRISRTKSMTLSCWARALYTLDAKCSRQRARQLSKVISSCGILLLVKKSNSLHHPKTPKPEPVRFSPEANSVHPLAVDMSGKIWEAWNTHHRSNISSFRLMDGASTERHAILHTHQSIDRTEADREDCTIPM